MAAISTPSQFNVLTSPYVDNFTSISGSDIVGVFGHVEFIQLQGVSVSVNREVHPIYVMGRTDPVSFVRGKRGVAGSIVTVAADRGSLYDIVDQFGVYAQAKGDIPLPGMNGGVVSRPQGILEQPEAGVLSEAGLLAFQLARPVYYDQLPPFDITLIGRNDSMAATVSRIGGVFIVSMGTGMSVDDNSIEQQMTFVALYYADWRPAGRRNYRHTERTSVYGSYDAFEASAQGAPVPGSGTLLGGFDRLGGTFGLDLAKALKA